MKNSHILLLILLLFGTFVLISNLNAQEMRIDVQVERIGNIELLPIYFHLSLVNINSSSIYLPKNIDIDIDKNFSILVEGDKVANRPCNLKGIVNRGSQLSNEYFFELASGKSFPLTIDVSGDAGVIFPGFYKVKIVWDSRNKYKGLEGYQGYAESQWIDIKIDKATGADEAFLDKQKEIWKEGYPCLTLEGAAIESAILQNMNSIYAAWSMFQNLGYSLKNAYSPEKAMQNIELATHDSNLNSFFLSGRTPWNDERVPIFRSSHEDAKKFARWKINNGHAVINLHPDFKFVDNLKLAIALNHILLGENKEGIAELTALSTKGKPEVSQWVSKFLELWRAKYPSETSKPNNK
jgi:hypothetical protein